MLDILKFSCEVEGVFPVAPGVVTFNEVVGGASYLVIGFLV